MILAMVVSIAAAGAPDGGVVPPITKTNWLKHPSVVEIRKIVETNEAAMKTGAYTGESRPVCEQPGLVTERYADRDAKGRIRRYRIEGGSDDAAYSILHHYDDQGRLRFAFTKGNAMNGTTLEVRMYFKIDGSQLWVDRQQKGPGHPGLDDWNRVGIAVDPEKDYTSPAPKGCTAMSFEP